ncbi:MULTISPECIES: hypothetical protein [unclassified Pseudomonas]|uniref:hypothetical protein n=1 Tax=unclassified Pseudomonas TaxID=196821 RepID=UPI00249BD031|nr:MULTISPECIES: hypothetical protein [unclassified Pseudomonas]MDI3248472.1 hypothetical protein [Pseudomonas sp. AL10]MDI3264360.1 hypothetical protein [Pseudomonas sp. AL15]
MNFEDFFSSVKESNIVLDIGSDFSTARFLNNEALFQLPLIALIVLLMAKDRRKPRVSEVGQLVGESIEASMPGFKGSSQNIGWSANLRIRTVKAIGFLELANLIVVDNLKSRLKITDLGKKVIERALGRNDDLSLGLVHAARAYRNICVARQLDLELE